MSDFDKIIKEKLRDAESPYPEHTWKEVHAQLNEKKRKPMLLIYALLAFIGIFSFSVIYKYGSYKPDSEYHNNKQAIANSQQLAVDTKTEPGEGHSGVITANQVRVNSSNHGNKMRDHLSEKVVGLIDASSADQNLKHGLADQFNEEGKSSSSSLLMDESESNVTSILGEPRIEEFASDQMKLDRSSNDLSLDGQSYEAGHSVFSGERDDVKLESLDDRVIKVFGTDPSAFIEEIKESMERHMVLECPTFVKKQDLSFAEVYFSNDYAMRKFSNRVGDSETYIDLRDKTEHLYISYSAGARVGLGWQSGIAFKTGIDFTQINEKFNYVDPHSIQKKTITILKYIYDEQFNIIDSIKTEEVIEIPGTNTILHKNKYTFIDLPILFQYTIAGKKRLSYAITVGPYINLAFARSGRILAPNSKSVIDLNDNNYYKNNIGLSFFGAFAINYQLTNKFQIFIEPGIRIMPNSITSNNYSINQKYVLANASAGMKFKI